MAAWRNERLAAVDPEADSEVVRLLSERREEDLVAERTRALEAASTDSCETSFLAAYRGHSRPIELPASCVA